jgi:hypothetical protein
VRKERNMKRIAAIVVLCMVFGVVMGCATPFPIGSIYTNLQLPVIATSNSGKAIKVGTAECTSILAIVATGDASIEAAKKNGGITKVYHVDWDVQNILGIFGRYKVTVYGE